MRKEEVKEFLNNIVRFKIKEIAACTGLGYLDCNPGHWRDSNDIIHEIEHMESRHLGFCNTELIRGMKFCKSSYSGQLKLKQLFKRVHIDAKGLSVGIQDEIKEYIVKAVYKCMEEKKDEIETELRRRGLL